MKNERDKIGNRKARVRAIVTVGLCLLVAGLTMLPARVAAGDGSGDDGMVAGFTALAVPLIVIGAIILMVGGLFALAKQKQIGLVAGVVGGLLLIIGIGAGLVQIFIVAPGGPESCNSNEYWDGSQCVPKGSNVYVAQWSCMFVTLAAGGPGGAHDAVTEFPDSPFTAADGGTPDLNKVIMVPVIDFVQGRAHVNVAIDDDAAVTNTAYVATDAYAFDIRCKLQNPLPAVAGGNQEVPIWGQMSFTYTAGTNENGSAATVLYCDQTAGHYAGFGLIADSGATADGHDADHTYVSYTQSKNCPQAPPLTGEWIPLGTSDGDPDGEWIASWLVLGTGISDYLSPPVNTMDTITVRLGTDPSNTQWKGNIVTLAIDLMISERT